MIPASERAKTVYAIDRLATVAGLICYSRSQISELCHVFKTSATYFFLIRLVGGGVQLGPLGTSANDWPICYLSLCPDTALHSGDETATYT
jgi:hypothetical protein